jgi:hypothetical protein
MLSTVVLFAETYGGFAMDTQQHDEVDSVAGDLLVGRDKIRAFLISLGMPESVDPYYQKRVGWPIGKSGAAKSASLIASKRRLVRYAQKIAAPQKTDAS